MATLECSSKDRKKYRLKMDVLPAPVVDLSGEKKRERGVGWTVDCFMYEEEGCVWDGMRTT